MGVAHQPPPGIGAGCHGLLKGEEASMVTISTIPWGPPGSTTVGLCRRAWSDLETRHASACKRDRIGCTDWALGSIKDFWHANCEVTLPDTNKRYNSFQGS